MANGQLESVEIGESLQYIERDLEIRLNPVLNSVRGFNGLDTIGERLFFRSNNALEIVDGFRELKLIGTQFDVNVNGDLTQFTGFESLEEIGGDFDISVIGDAGLSLFSELRRIGGSFDLRLTLEDNFGYENLEYIGEDFSINGSSSRTFPTFDRLRQVGGNFSMSTFVEMETFDAFNNLDTIGGYLRIRDLRACTGFEGFRELKFVGNEFSISDATELTALPEFSQLSFIGEDFQLGFSSATFLSALEVIPKFSSLKEIAGSLRIEECRKLISLDGFPALRKIGQDLELENIYGLEQLTGLNAVDTIGGSVTINFERPIETVHTLRQVQHIGGDLNLSTNTPVTFNGLNEVKFIGGGFALGQGWVSIGQAFNKLVAVGGDFRVHNNGALKNLDFLKNLRLILGRIRIENMDELSSINALSQVRSTTINQIEDPDPGIMITGNSQLSVCDLQSICGYILLGGGETSFAGNLMGCNSEAELDCSSKGFTGQVFYDYNRDGVRDLDEPGMSEELLVLPDGRSVYSNLNGWYYVRAVDGETVTVSIVDTAQWIVTSEPEEQLVSFNSTSPLDTIDFGIFMAEEVHRLESYTVAEPFVCNRWVSMEFEYLNSGSYEESGQMVLSYPPNVDSLFFLTPPDSINVDSSELIWNFDGLRTFEKLNYAIDFKVPPVDNLGDTLVFKQLTNIHLDTSLVTIDSFLYEDIVLCSYDPNDKKVSPTGQGVEHFIRGEEQLTYTIRFQNLGNAPAEDVKVIDTLSEHLDPSTFRLLSQSHPCEILREGQILTFRFDNIFLPDSLSDPEGSNGHIVFSLYPDRGLPPLTLIENQGYIYFDSNPAIITNVAYNRIEDTSSTFTTSGSKIIVYPNPANDQLFIKGLTRGKFEIRMYDLMGREVLMHTEDHFSVAHLDAGLYLLVITEEEVQQAVMVKLVR